MDPATAHSGRSPRETERPAGRRWLQSDEGWTPGEDAARLLAAIGIALGRRRAQDRHRRRPGRGARLPQLPRRGGPRGVDRGAPRRGGRHDHLRARPDDPVLEHGRSQPHPVRRVQPRVVPPRRGAGHHPLVAPAPRVRARALCPDHRRSRPRGPHGASRGGRAGPRGVDHPPGGDREPGGRADARGGWRRDPRSRAGRPGRGGRRGQPRHRRRGVGRGDRGPRLPGLRARHHRGARPRVAPARGHRVGHRRVPPEPRLLAGPVPGQPAPPRAGVAGRRRDRGAADDRGVANAGGDRLPVRPRPGLRRRHARPGDPAGGPGRPGARPRARVGRRPAVTRGPRARPGTARPARAGERCAGLRDRHRARGSRPCPA